MAAVTGQVGGLLAARALRPPLDERPYDGVGTDVVASVSARVLARVEAEVSQRSPGQAQLHRPTVAGRGSASPEGPDGPGSLTGSLRGSVLEHGSDRAEVPCRERLLGASELFAELGALAEAVPSSFEQLGGIAPEQAGRCLDLAMDSLWDPGRCGLHRALLLCNSVTPVQTIGNTVTDRGILSRCGP